MAVPQASAQVSDEGTGPGTLVVAASQASVELLDTPASPGGSDRIEIVRPIARLWVSRAADGLGKPVYAARTDFSGAQRLVAFSMRRPPAAKIRALAANSLTALPRSLPLSAASLTSRFGYRRHPILGYLRQHSGIDLAAPAGTPVFATSPGTISAAGWAGGYGLLVEVNHGPSVQTRYGHLSQIHVAPGQSVRAGDLLGLVGSTGRSTGPHLHYEVRAHGQAIDPLSGR